MVTQQQCVNDIEHDLLSRMVYCVSLASVFSNSALLAELQASVGPDNDSQPIRRIKPRADVGPQAEVCGSIGQSEQSMTFAQLLCDHNTLHDE